MSIPDRSISFKDKLQTQQPLQLGAKSNAADALAKLANQGEVANPNPIQDGPATSQEHLDQLRFAHLGFNNQNTAEAAAERQEIANQEYNERLEEQQAEWSQFWLRVASEAAPQVQQIWAGVMQSGAQGAQSLAKAGGALFKGGGQA